MTSDRRRRAFRSPAGRTTVRWRWEVGMPLIVVGTLMAYAVADASGGQIIFWVGVLLAVIGTIVFFSGSISR